MRRKRKVNRQLFKKRKTNKPAYLLAPNAETKCVDVITTQTAFNATGTFTLLNGLVPGTNLQNRIGRSVKLKSLAIRGYVFNNQAGAAPIADYLRAIVFYDRQPNGAAPAVSDLLQSVSVSGSTASTALDGINLSNSDRFAILADFHWKVDVPAGAVANNQPATVTTDFTRFSIRRFIKLKGLEARFNTLSAGTIGDFSAGALWLLTISLASTANAQYEMSWTSRCRFLDP